MIKVTADLIIEGYDEFNNDIDVVLCPTNLIMDCKNGRLKIVEMVEDNSFSKNDTRLVLRLRREDDKKNPSNPNT